MPYKKLTSSQYVDPDFLLKVIQGRAGRYFAFTKFGTNPAVGTTEEDIWETGGVQQYLTTPETMDIVSDSANDTDGGTGANTVHIIGMNEGYNVIRETINLDGLTPVVTTKTYLRIFRMTVVSAGSLQTNDGDITISATTSGFNQGSALSGAGKTLKSQFTIPDGFFGALLGWRMSDLANDQVTFRLRVREQNGIFVIRRQFGVNGEGFVDDFNVPIMIPPRSDIKITGQKVTGGGTDNSDASYCMLFIDQREVQSIIDEDSQ